MMTIQFRAEPSSKRAGLWLHLKNIWTWCRYRLSLSNRPLRTKLLRKQSHDGQQILPSFLIPSIVILHQYRPNPHCPKFHQVPRWDLWLLTAVPRWLDGTLPPWSIYLNHIRRFTWWLGTNCIVIMVVKEDKSEKCLLIEWEVKKWACIMRLSFNIPWYNVRMRILTKSSSNGASRSAAVVRNHKCARRTAELRWAKLEFLCVSPNEGQIDGAMQRF